MGAAEPTGRRAAPGPRRSELRTGFLLALLAAGAFGVLPILGKFAYAEGLSVPTLLAWRFSLGCLLLWAVVFARRDGGRAGIGARRRMALLALGGLYSLNSGLYFMALERIPATMTSLVFYVYPAIVTALGAVFLKRAVARVGLGALVLALAGVVLTVGYTRGEMDAAGIGMAVAAAAIVAVYFTLGEIALAGVPTLHGTALVLTGTALAFLMWKWATGGMDRPPTAAAWLLVGLMATVSTAFSILALLASIRRLGAGNTAVVSTLEPAVTAVLAAFALGEQLEPRQYLGGALILSGVALLRIATRRSAPALADT